MSGSAKAIEWRKLEITFARSDICINKKVCHSSLLHFFIRFCCHLFSVFISYFFQTYSFFCHHGCFTSFLWVYAKISFFPNNITICDFLMLFQILEIERQLIGIAYTSRERSICKPANCQVYLPRLVFYRTSLYTLHNLFVLWYARQWPWGMSLCSYFPFFTFIYFHLFWKICSLICKIYKEITWIKTPLSNVSSIF